MMLKKKLKFDIATLKKNDITILTLDERWNRLFKIIPITGKIKKYQDNLNKLIGKEAALFQEQQSIEPEKKKHMKNIIALTQEAFEKNNEQAKRSLTASKLRIEQLNKRAEELEDELLQMGSKISESNFKLLEETVKYVYNVMSKSRARKAKLESELKLLRKRLKELQIQRQNLTTDWTEVYAFFHDLLGSEELTRLDMQFLNEEVETDETGNSE
jgi:hypothetical protein